MSAESRDQWRHQCRASVAYHHSGKNRSLHITADTDYSVICHCKVGLPFTLHARCRATPDVLWTALNTTKHATAVYNARKNFLQSFTATLHLRSLGDRQHMTDPLAAICNYMFWLGVRPQIPFTERARDPI